MKTGGCIILLICLSDYSFGQKDTAEISPRSKIKAVFESFRDSSNAKWINHDTLASHARQLDAEQFRTALAMEKQKQNEIAEDAYALEHRERSFDFQYHASIAIFIMVIIIVLTGLSFSGWQFNLAMKQLKIKDVLEKSTVVGTNEANNNLSTSGQLQPTENSPGFNSLKSEIEFSPTSIKANSSVLGVIILIISIAFFYLYLIYVYPIKYLSPGGTSSMIDSPTVQKEK